MDGTPCFRASECAVSAVTSVQRDSVRRIAVELEPLVHCNFPASVTMWPGMIFGSRFSTHFVNMNLV